MEIPHYEPFYLNHLADLRAEAARLGLDLPAAEDPTPLRTPLTIGSKSVPNRFCAQPISGNDATPQGAPGPLTHRRYRRYARGGFGLIWVESTAVTEPVSGSRLWLCQENLGAFRDFVTGIRDEAEHHWGRGVVVILQLSPLNDPSVHRFPLTADATAILTDDEIRALSEATIAAAALAAEAGFDGVDIQASHGALAGELLGAFTRVGDFGGPFENRSRFLRDTITRIAAQKSGLILASRLCAYDATQHPFGFGVSPDDYRAEDPEEPLRLAADLHAAGLDLLNVTSSSPNHRAPAHIRPLSPLSDTAPTHEHPLTTLARQLRLARTLRSAVAGLPVVASGFSWLRHLTPHVAAAAIAEGYADFAGLGRGALAYPDAPAETVTKGAMAAESACMVCFACNTLHEDGAAVGCVIQDPATYATHYQNSRRLAPDRLREEARRCHFCEAAPCISADPTHTDIPSFIRAFLDGDFLKAYDIIRGSNPLPELTSILSSGWLHAEGACIESALTGTPVPILDLQYSIAWHARDRGKTAVRLPDKPTNSKIAVVGGGPAGIAATIRLLELGHAVDLFEASHILGGTPARIIPNLRLPDTAPEINAILGPARESGRLRVHFGEALTSSGHLASLRSTHTAVLLAAGVWKERSLGIIEGVVGGLAFLESVKLGQRLSVPPRVAVLAGGDSAMDAAAAAKNLGAKDVFVIFGGPRSAMHWHMPESWFASPGVHALMLCDPLGYTSSPSGTLAGVRVLHTELCQESILRADLAIEAMGLTPANEFADPNGPALDECGLVRVDSEFRTSLGRTYAAGGIVNGGASVARCIAEGLAAADSIHHDLS